jgi:hypothetical protein
LFPVSENWLALPAVITRTALSVKIIISPPAKHRADLSGEIPTTPVGINLETVAAFVA